jgi:hypothetical protein
MTTLEDATLILAETVPEPYGEDVIRGGGDPRFSPRYGVFAFYGIVIAEAPDGSRWRCTKTEYRIFPWDALDDTFWLADQARRWLAQGKKLNPKYWVPTIPCYGSEAYIALGLDLMDEDLARCIEEESNS